MDRKNFIRTSTAIVAASCLPKPGEANSQLTDPDKKFIIPSYLKKGDVIGITSPAGYITEEEMLPAIQLIESWGFKIRLGTSIGKRDFTFGGTDEERLHDLQYMLNTNEVKAVLCARGGYGSVRIIDRIKWNHFVAKPKWVIGFSDITVLHAQISRLNIASIHSKMTNSFPDDPATADNLQMQTIDSIRQSISGERMSYETPPSEFNRNGTTTGRLIGGNLRTLETLAGTSSDILTADKILFLEDTGEYMYSIDRMFWNLKRTGKLSTLKGLIIGGFGIKTDDEGEEFGKTIYDVVMEKVASYKYPVCFHFPVGHQRNNYALKFGVEHRLIVNSSNCILTEI